MEADELIDLLELLPHPEGGYYRETFRDAAMVNGRACSTAIYFLLKEGQVSHWHRVDAVEVWHWHAGAPLRLEVAPPAGESVTHTLGNDVFNGQRPQAIVPSNHWQSARSLGKWTLVGCTVAPGFQFEGFELAEPDFTPTTTRD